MNILLKTLREVLIAVFADAKGARPFVRDNRFKYDEQRPVLKLQVFSCGKFNVGDVVSLDGSFSSEEGPWVDAFLNYDNEFVIVGFVEMTSKVKDRWRHNKVEELFAILISKKSFLEYKRESESGTKYPDVLTNIIPTATARDFNLYEGRPLWDYMSPILLFSMEWLDKTEDQGETEKIKPSDNEIKAPIVSNVGHGFLITVDLNGNRLTFQGSFWTMDNHYFYAKEIMETYPEGTPVCVELNPNLRGDKGKLTLIYGTIVTVKQTRDDARVGAVTRLNGIIKGKPRLHGQWWSFHSDQDKLQCPKCHCLPCGCKDRVCAICGEGFENGQQRVIMECGLPKHLDCRLIYTEEELAMILSQRK